MNSRCHPGAFAGLLSRMKLVLFATAALASFRILAGPVHDMAGAAKNFLAALNDAQRAKAEFPFESEERENWHFIPKERNGVTLKELEPAQRALAYGLLSSALSHQAFLKSTTIITLERILQDIEGPKRTFPRDPELYHVSIFGAPDAKGTWGWRFEGHHLSFNITIVKGELVSGSPSFFGTNPAEVRTGPRAGLRVLAAEEDLGRELVRSLDEKQRAVAIVDTQAPADILTTNKRVAELGEAKGLPLGKMTKAQQATAQKLLNEYAGRLRNELAAADLKQIERAGWDKIVFAWAGGVTKGEKHYYRLHGPTFLLEYDNTQNDGNHVHAVWRELQGDFGRDLLAEHLKASHAK
jgi:hypothetical protein